MIAIAGAKGGCGKTITTLGLAEAFARRGTPALAVDADRQLPNLHVVAGVDREPTLTAVTTGTDVLTVAQESPRSSDVGVVPAPTSTVDVESALEAIDLEYVQTLVDCPSGAGPDVAEAMSAAEGVVVVTTDDERSVDAAKTTVEMAHRLGVPVLGLVLNECQTEPDSIRSWIDVPILGRVPSAEQPLLEEQTQVAYEAIVRTLQTKNVATPTPRGCAEDLLPTGIDVLDRRLGGGFPPGTVVALTAAPDSQAEQFLYELTAIRGALYLTTRRSVDNVTRALEGSSLETGNPTIRTVDGPDRLERAAGLIEELPDEANLIIDTADALEEAETSAYTAFLNDLKDRMVETGAIAVLYCLQGESPPENRTETTYHADVVLDLETVSPSGTMDIKHYLSVTKHRGDSGFAETIELPFEREPKPVTVTPSGEPR